MTKFKIGDIITGNPENPYRVTTNDAIMRVFRVENNSDEIKVTIINHKIKRFIGSSHDVNARYFILYNNFVTIDSSFCFECKKRLKTKSEKFTGLNNKIYCKDCFDTLFTICDECGKIVNHDNSKFVDDENLCLTCFLKKYTYCYSCGEITPIAETHIYRDNTYCDECYIDNFIECECCGNIISREDSVYDDNDDEELCSNCFSQRYGDYDGVDFFPSEKELISNNNLKVTPAFGVELECNVDDTNYYVMKHDCKKYFSAVEDGSLANNGVEYVSVPLTMNKRGFSILKTFTDLLREHHDTDNSCGCHIHINLFPYVDVKNDNINKSVGLTKRLLLGYKNIEKIMFNAMPRGRGGSQYADSFNNKYEDSEILGNKGWNWVSEFYREVIKNKNDLPCDKSHRKRYCWINAHSIFFKNTLEIRLLEGTLDYHTIKNWVTINSKIINYLATNNINKAKTFNKEKLFSIINKPERDFLLKRIMIYN